ncbi:MAG: DUF6318 family protein [Dermabacter sp.]|nr:DUF6318 family protein [Dermabacter sp.]
MSRTTQRVVILLVALALVIPMGLVGLGQLSGGSEEQVVPDSAQDVRPTVDPGTQPQPTATTPPDAAAFAAMGEPTEAGALATTDYLFATYAYMIATGDTSQWRELSAPECEQCTAFSANAEGLHAQGGWIVGGEITLSDQQVSIEGDTASVAATFHEAAATLVDDPTREAVSREPSSGQFTVNLRFEGGRWLITSMTVS